MSSHFTEATSHNPPRVATTCNTVPKTETLTGRLSTHRAPRSNTDSKLLLYEGVVDPLGDVMEGFSVIRTDDRNKER